MDEKSLARKLFDIFASVLATAIVVKGIVAVVPDMVLLNRYGEIHGIFQLALAVIALMTFGATARWLDRND